MNKTFLQANIGTILGFLVLVTAFIFQIQHYMSQSILITLAICSLYLFSLTFEYQRITLTIARYLNGKHPGQINIVDIQMLLAPSHMGIFVIIESLITGLVLGYLLRTSILLFIGFLIMKYVLLALLPIPIPFKLLFSLLKKELPNAGKVLVSQGQVELMVELIQLVKHMPHNKTYEDWVSAESAGKLSNIS